ncbi:hypothetical protein C8R43DRAFT_942849 [Mycena crocata]|nr:hypothetical protein C8R43DRAFT_942848 [Mycena crocata]KAJ7177584.1 hypothetical protein C8R43DRAFT_942849 [Mycena crocata]
MGCETESQARESYLYMKYRQAAKRKVNLDGLRNGEYRARKYEVPPKRLDQRKARTEDVTETAPLGSASRNISGKHLKEITTLPGEHGFGRGERGFGRGPGRKYGLPTCSRGSNSFNGGLNVPDVDHNFGL